MGAGGAGDRVTNVCGPGRALGFGVIATLRDVARLAGVHPGTVSRVLNEHTRGLVNDQTAHRVQQAATELGYRADPLARGLRTKRSFSIGILVPDITNPIFPPAVRGVDDALRERGYTTLVGNTDNDLDRARTMLDVLLARRVDGLVIATAVVSTDGLEPFLDGLTIPVVMANRSSEDARCPAVVPDDKLGIEMVVNHLYALGHRQIAHLAGPQDASTGLHRLAAFRHAAATLGLDAKAVHHAPGFSIAAGLPAARKLLAAKRPPTAIVAANDLLALGCYDAAAELGLTVPGDLSVTGFNDMPFADRFSPALTTVRVPMYDIGRHAAHILIEQLAGLPAARTETLPVDLVVRASTARP